MLRRNSEAESKEAKESEWFDALTELHDNISYQSILDSDDWILASDLQFYQKQAYLQFKVDNDTGNPISPLTTENLFEIPLPTTVRNKLKKIAEECRDNAIKQQKVFDAQQIKAQQELIAVKEEIVDLQSALKTALDEIIELRAKINNHSIQQRSTPKIYPSLAEINKQGRNALLQLEAKQPLNLEQTHINSRFMEAIKKFNKKNAAFFLTHGAEVNHKDHEGYPALVRMVAETKIKPAIIRPIIEMLCTQYKANVNAQDAYGNTALHHAAAHSDLWTCQFLLSKNANRLLLNKENQTPLQLAQEANAPLDPNIKKLLVNKQNDLFQKSPSFFYTSENKPNASQVRSYLPF